MQEIDDRTPLMGGPVSELTRNEEFIFSLYHGHRAKKDAVQASVPNDLDLNLIGGPTTQLQLPRVELTEDEKEARAEDEARRAAYIEAAARQERKKSDLYKKSHQNFLNTFDTVTDTN